MRFQTAPPVVDELIARTLTEVGAAFPAIVSGLAFLVIAGVGITGLLWIVRRGLRRAIPDAEPGYREFVARIVAVFLWFGVALVFLSILGLEELAAALGTATGFLALGVAYALSGMIADAVAGVYLFRDPDFNPGDEVTVGDMTGVVEAIELRKTRFAVERDTVVRGNADIEKRWTKRGSPADRP